ncbi:MAG: isoleucine--tRNA ligase [Candidatus Moranbacteria bacterium]|nr:isoleucine--tRNA ligase [Candidatus Moranbacteria bacterium]NTW46465.1 isoleucine--tRNA ligase [Candidatus Moranbacteria bacterium]
MIRKIDPKSDFPKLEEEVLAYWDANDIFGKSVGKDAPKGDFVFFDGPPFATGTPHYGHIVASAIKDAVPRYFTMRGYRVERKWGWDCHGLPIENIAEKELGIRHKKEIEELGVAKFNETCRSKVLEYAEEWKRVMHRFGRWADMEHPYKTMDRDYMESVWWVFRELWDKGLIYEDYRSMHICPRCETTLSQQEVSEGYKDVKDLSVVAKFELVDEPGTFVLAWTTTPWTLPGNVALAVGKDIVYTKAEIEKIEGTSNFKEGETYIFSKERAKVAARELFGGKIGAIQIASFDEDDGVLRSVVITNDDGTETRIIFKSTDVLGADLVGKSYKPLFDYYAKDESLENRENGWKIYAADFVTTEDGTGVVHIAPAFGEDDMALGKKEKLPFVQHVRMDGAMRDEVTDFAGLPVKPIENPQATDVEIIRNLAKRGLLFSKEKFEHSYPHCWRCDTPLLNYATSSWFIRVTELKDRAIALAKDIHWSPEHVRAGRFGKWLEGARDWSISRQRYWASVMPLWRCSCGEVRVFASVAELEEASGRIVDDLHKHVVDQITVPCEKCGGVMRRIPDVLDTWFDSGSMPYAQAHYPFEGKESFDSRFPADFIAEGIDQTRAWFYYLHVMATALRDGVAFRNVIVNGIVLAEDGKKMSKRLKNYPDPMDVIEKHGSDALRLYMLSSPIVSAENLNFSERELSESTRNLFRMLWNSYSFFTTYASIDGWDPKKNREQSTDILDRWILSELQVLIRDIDAAMEAYDLQKAARLFVPFIDDLSNWYIRRNRKRFWKNENDGDKDDAYATLYEVLVTLSKLMAPFTPFLSEEIYRNLTDCHSGLDPESKNVPKSVHLAEWPESDEKFIDVNLTNQMIVLRGLVTQGLGVRAEQRIKVRQPISDVLIFSEIKLEDEYIDILKDELNVKEVKTFLDRDEYVAFMLREANMKYKTLADAERKMSESRVYCSIALNIEITPQLALEGEAREIIRAIQEGRKKAGFEVSDRITLGILGKERVFDGNAAENLSGFGDEIAHETLATEVVRGDIADADYRETVTIEGEEFSFSLRRNR